MIYRYLHFIKYLLLFGFMAYKLIIYVWEHVKYDLSFFFGSYRTGVLFFRAL